MTKHKLKRELSYESTEDWKLCRKDNHVYSREDGVLYTREVNDNEEYGNYTPMSKFLLEGYADNKLKDGHRIDEIANIICSCGNDTFTLSYGEYEISGKCTECKCEEVMYSG